MRERIVAGEAELRFEPRPRAKRLRLTIRKWGRTRTTPKSPSRELGFDLLLEKEELG